MSYFDAVAPVLSTIDPDDFECTITYVKLRYHSVEHGCEVIERLMVAHVGTIEAAVKTYLADITPSGSEHIIIYDQEMDTIYLGGYERGDWQEFAEYNDQLADMPGLSLEEWESDWEGVERLTSHMYTVAVAKLSYHSTNLQRDVVERVAVAYTDDSHAEAAAEEALPSFYDPGHGTRYLYAEFTIKILADNVAGLSTIEWEAGEWRDVAQYKGALAQAKAERKAEKRANR